MSCQQCNLFHCAFTETMQLHSSPSCFNPATLDFMVKLRFFFSLSFWALYANALCSCISFLNNKFIALWRDPVTYRTGLQTFTLLRKIMSDMGGWNAADAINTFISFLMYKRPLDASAPSTDDHCLLKSFDLPLTIRYYLISCVTGRKL